MRDPVSQRGFPQKTQRQEFQGKQFIWKVILENTGKDMELRMGKGAKDGVTKQVTTEGHQSLNLLNSGSLQNLYLRVIPLKGQGAGHLHTNFCQSLVVCWWEKGGINFPVLLTCSLCKQRLFWAQESPQAKRYTQMLAFETLARIFHKTQWDTDRTSTA